MLNGPLKILAVVATLALPLGVSPALADGDSGANVPGGFADVLRQTRGVVLRVPVNAAGEENTDAAELRFYQKDAAVTPQANPDALWRGALDPGRSPEVLGTNAPAGDSSTWGWYNWYNIGWASPYYYSYYYPTFYYGGYSYYNYSYNWNWYGYRYYYYSWWY